MKKLKALILTDHSNHSSENSLYALTTELVSHQNVKDVYIASRKTESNASFFSGKLVRDISCTKVDTAFRFFESKHPLDAQTETITLGSFDFVWLRLPPPLSKEFLTFLESIFSDCIIINSPSAIYDTGSKAFLMNFTDVCPPMRICNSLKDIIKFGLKFPIVLKPFREYGGKGIVKINGSIVSEGSNTLTLEEFKSQYQQNPVDYLAVKYLKNVRKGDKRIIVINGEILGASLRLPAEGSWICNVAMGGSSHEAEVTIEEVEMINTIDPLLNSLGIIMYGIDTLVGDDGKRVLSEINTTSIGGLPQIAELNGKPLVKRGIDLIVNNVLNRLK